MSQSTESSFCFTTDLEAVRKGSVVYPFGRIQLDWPLVAIFPRQEVLGQALGGKTKGKKV